MNKMPTNEPYVIHVGVDVGLLGQFEDDARRSEFVIIRLDFTGLEDKEDLANYLAVAFMFPHETRGLDAAVDLISDLEWIGSRSGYLVVVDGLDVAPNLVEPFARMLPNIVDRWRSQAVPFIVAITSNSEQLTSALRRANDQMATAGRLLWAQPGTGSVKVEVHRGSEQARDSS